MSSHSTPTKCVDSDQNLGDFVVSLFDKLAFFLTNKVKPDQSMH